MLAFILIGFLAYGAGMFVMWICMEQKYNPPRRRRYRHRWPDS